MESVVGEEESGKCLKRNGFYEGVMDDVSGYSH